jgi:hypothetical protein
MAEKPKPVQRKTSNQLPRAFAAEKAMMAKMIKH